MGVNIGEYRLGFAITKIILPIVFQSKYYDKILNKEMLLRAIVELAGEDLKVISVYKTSKIDRYWVKE